jgi:uncharacterized membrane protein (UPF0136 family)
MRYIVAFYGILIFVGGLMGHAKAGSTASLVMGVVFGALLLIAAGFMFSQRNYLKGSYFALVLTFILDAFFSYRYLSSMKFLPSGLLSLISLGVLLLLVSHIRQKPSVK